MKRQDSVVTIQDVAQLAGVSPATVSKALNGAPYVSKEARERVLAAASKLNFRPNVIARSLRSKRTLTLGLITDDLEGVFTTAMVRGVEDVASEHGFISFLCNSYGKAEQEKRHLEALLAKQVDGVILMSGYRVRERGAPAIPLNGVPVVYLYQYTNDTPAPCVIPDDMEGGAIGTRRLLEVGRRRIALINGPAARYEATHLRFEGYKQALQVAGVTFDPRLVCWGEWNEHAGYTHARELMALAEPPDAIFCAGDSLAVGALDGLHDLGYRIPQDVAVIGFDNRHFTAFQRPPLTTVALPLYEMGKQAANLLVAAIASGEAKAELHKAPCYLVQRESDGTPQ